MAFNFSDLSPEQIQKGMACKSLDEFKDFVKDEGLDLDDKEAQAYFEEMYEMELSDEKLDAVAGGIFVSDSLCAVHYYEDESSVRIGARRMSRR